MKCLSNPATFSINELLFAVSTNDILFHLQNEEITRRPPITNRPARIAAHILSQRSFYPLFPPPPRDGLPWGLNGVGASLDLPHFRLADIGNATPDFLVLPSMLGPFAKVVGHVVVVNPGIASKPKGAGTWVEMVVKPKEVEVGAMDEDVAHDAAERTRVEVRRV